MYVCMYVSSLVPRPPSLHSYKLSPVGLGTRLVCHDIVSIILYRMKSPLYVYVPWSGNVVVVIHGFNPGTEIKKKFLQQQLIG
jgi:Ethanolamine utilization protein EutJ (predicted chaperonin)